MLDRSLWPQAKLGEAVSALLHASQMAATRASGELQAKQFTGRAEPSEFVEWQAKRFSCVADPVELGLGQLEMLLPSLCPMMLSLEGAMYVPLLSISKDWAVTLACDGKPIRVSAKTIYAALRKPSYGGAMQEFSALLRVADLADQQDLLNKLLNAEVTGKGCRAGWSFRRQPKPGWRGLFTDSRMYRNGALLMTAHVAQYSLWLISWWILGRVSLRGQMDTAWLTAWALLLFSLIPLRILTTYTQGVMAVGAGAALKRHLLLGAMRMDAQQARVDGIGSILSQVFESEAVENLALTGGISGVLASVELLVAAVVLGPLSLLLLVMIALGGGTLYLFAHRYESWTATRMRMSEQLIESMVGHRTRVAQQPQEQWHQREDGDLHTYLSQSRQVDRTGAWLVSAVPRMWLLLALVALAPTALSGLEEQSMIALKLGGILLAFSALQRLMNAAVDIAGTWTAARRIAPLFDAANRQEAVGTVPPESPEVSEHGKVMEIEKVEFRYDTGSKLALRPASLKVHHGERVLLEGPSGGGKSTFSVLIAGMRQPTAGLLLAGGLDRHTLGEQGWRRRVSMAPQFHDNYILTETLAFNLLLGRSWPPRENDLEEAESLCRELGLGGLLDRMPSGLMQMVGEGGWQLSHGERSRVFLARALLQRSSLTILDESFGALDPETAHVALQCTLANTDALMVIAHP